MISFPDHIVQRLADARYVTVLTGAGASAESGIPTFREPGGLWARFDPTELASYGAFVKNPVRVQSWYSARSRAAAGVDPNPCHLALAALEEIVDSVTIVTQNVDGLHQRAGSSRVLELHGNIHRVYCSSCRRRADMMVVDPDAHEPATCACGGLLRPDVVWFGEMLPEDAYAEAVEATASADVFLSIGTSSEVYPAAGLSFLAVDNGATVIEINPNRTPLSASAHFAAMGPAGVLTPALVSAARVKMGLGVD